MKRMPFAVFFTGLVFLIGAVYLNLLALKTPGCANSITCIKDLAERFEPGSAGVYEGRSVTVPTLLASASTPAVLGADTSDRRIAVDLGAQRLYAYEGDTVVMEFPVSTGKWWPTPTGEFKTWIKLRSTRMSGGNWAAGTYYNLPNVPHTMYFYNDQYPKTRGFGLHGAYWHTNFGHPMSHGCVNIGLPDAERLFNWAPLGIRVSIYGTTPKI